MFLPLICFKYVYRISVLFHCTDEYTGTVHDASVTGHKTRFKHLNLYNNENKNLKKYVKLLVLVHFRGINLGFIKCFYVVSVWSIYATTEAFSLCRLIANVL